MLAPGKIELRLPPPAARFGLPDRRAASVEQRDARADGDDGSARRSPRFGSDPLVADADTDFGDAGALGGADLLEGRCDPLLARQQVGPRPAAGRGRRL